MEIVYYGNIIEGIFWIGVSLIFFLSACKRREQHRLFCIYGGVVFVVFACSDFYEAQTGAWWEPWWLILWNAGCCLGIGGIIFWYVKINGSWAATMAKLRQPVFRRKPPKEKEEIEQDQSCSE